MGLLVNSIRALEFPRHKGWKNSNVLYTTLEDYLNDFTAYDSLVVQNYESLFQVHLIICLSLLLMAKRGWLFRVLLDRIASVRPKAERNRRKGHSLVKSRGAPSATD